MYIDDPRRWRISRSGCSIITGWSNENKTVARYAGETTDRRAFEEWTANAKLICDLYNARLTRERQPAAENTDERETGARWQ